MPFVIWHSVIKTFNDEINSLLEKQNTLTMYALWWKGRVFCCHDVTLRRWVCGYQPTDRNPILLKGTAHLKQHTFWIAVFSSAMKIFKITFQDVVDNIWKIPVALFSLQFWVICHCLGEHVFYVFEFNSPNAASDFRFCFEKWFGCTLKFVPRTPIDNKPALVQVMAWCRTGD